ncbi:MAG: type IV pilus assembly protein PilV [Methylophilaceae bacterium]|jgi:type IV pilus assembly protein PilV
MKPYSTSLPATQLPKSQKGVVLLEALIAVLVFSFGVLALAGLQAAMIKNTDEAKYRAEATFVAQDKLSEVWLTGTDNLAGHVVAGSAVPQLPGGQLTVAVNANRDVTITVNWTLPGGAQHAYETTARVEGLN